MKRPLTWRLIPAAKLPACQNMAIDEAIFRTYQSRPGSPPVLRFYIWAEPSVSVGYFQDVFREVDVEACRRHRIGIIRRPTGGKAVLHRYEVTYSVVANGDCSSFPRDILGTYRVITACIASGLAALGIETDMPPSGRPARRGDLSAACFSASSPFELLADGRKLCGSAQVRAQGVFLQHGSLLIDFDPVETADVLLSPDDDRVRQIEGLRMAVTSVKDCLGYRVKEERLCSALMAGFEQWLDVSLIPGELTPEEEELKVRLIHGKYMRDEWNMMGICPVG